MQALEKGYAGPQLPADFEFSNREQTEELGINEMSDWTPEELYKITGAGRMEGTDGKKVKRI